MNRLVTLVVFISLTGVQTVATASHHIQQDSSIIRYNSVFHPVIAKDGMVSSQRRISSEVGAAVLSKGGNAIDAAIATAMALAVVLPRAGNIGGGGFMLLYLAESKQTIALDYREVAPLLASRDMFLDKNGNINRQKEQFSHSSSGVPGTVAGLWYAHKNYGSLPWRELLQPAIDLAEKGFEVSYDLSENLKKRRNWLQSNAETKRIFYKKNGADYEKGDILYQKDLAKTLKIIAKKGRDGFYKGEVARQIAKTMSANAGLISEQDLEEYQVRVRKPVVGNYRGYHIAAMSPPSSGGVHIIQMLNILENFNLRGYGYGSAQSLHYITQAMKLAYRDRSIYLGDSDFHPVPIASITSKDYAKQLVKTIKRKRVTDPTGKPRLFTESYDTTHFSIVDKYGNAVANTYTLNFSFGNGIVVPGLGFLLNNEMADFAAKVGEADAFGMIGGIGNAIQPKKRPLSSMTPLIIFDSQKKPFLVTGSPGGSRIISTVLQVVLNVIDFDMNIAEATLMPRIHHQWRPNVLNVEKGFSPDTLKLLKKFGHKLKVSSSMGSVQSIIIKDNYLYGASDTRRPGAGTVGIN